MQGSKGAESGHHYMTHMLMGDICYIRTFFQKRHVVIFCVFEIKSGKKRSTIPFAVIAVDTVE